MPYFVTSEKPGGAEVLAMAESSDECRTLAQAFRAADCIGPERICERDGLANVYFGTNPRIVAADDSALANAVAAELVRIAADVKAGAAIADGNAATWRAIAEARQGGIAPAIRPQPGERVSPDGAAIRSNAAWRALAETAIAAHETAENRYRAESLECNALRERLADANASVSEWKAEAETQDKARGAAIRETETIRRELVETKARNAAQETTIRTYREQRDAQSARAVKAEQLAAARLADATAFRIKHMDAEKAVSATSHLMAELGGLTLAMLPRGAYGGALASAYADAKAAIAAMDKGAA